MRFLGTGSLGYLGAIVAFVVMSAVAAVAHAAEAPSRPEYVQRLEAICRPDSEATQRAMRGVREDVSDGRTKVAARKFGTGARIFGGSLREMKPVPRPVDDLGRLKKWFFYLGRQEKYLREVTVQLEADRVIRAQRAIARFIHNGNLANNVVLSFGFDYCDFRFSRYGGR